MNSLLISTFSLFFVVLLAPSTLGKEPGSCALSDKQLEVAVDCMKKVTGSSDPDTIAKALENENISDKVEECLYMALEIISGNNFNAEKFIKMVQEMNATAEIKKQLQTLMDGCVAKHDKAKAKEIVDCMEDDIEKICILVGKSESGEMKSAAMLAAVEAAQAAAGPGGKSTTGSPQRST